MVKVKVNKSFQKQLTKFNREKRKQEEYEAGAEKNRERLKSAEPKPKRMSKKKREKELEKMLKPYADPLDRRNNMADSIRKSAANTKAFRTPQKFGPASPVRHISKDDK